jgi:hypothetical protein
MKDEILLNLNVHELGILLMAMRVVEFSDEVQIQKECGSMRTLYDRLYTEYLKMDRTNVVQECEPYVEPSF